MTGRLFIGVYPTCIVYADKAREQHGDYVTVARLDYLTLKLVWVDRSRSEALWPAILAHAVTLQSQRGQPFEVSQCGQTVTLGGN